MNGIEMLNKIGFASCDVSNRAEFTDEEKATLAEMGFEISPALNAYRREDAGKHFIVKMQDGIYYEELCPWDGLEPEEFAKIYRQAAYSSFAGVVMGIPG